MITRRPAISTRPTPHRTATALRRALLATLLAGCCVLGGTLGMASGADAAELRGDTRITDDRIHLGDLFDALSPEQAAIVVGAAPSPGRRMTFDALALSRIAGNFGVAWQSRGDERLVIERPAVEVGASQIQAALSAAIVKAGAPAGTEVVLDNTGMSVLLAANSDTSIGFNNLVYDAAHNRVIAEMVIPAQGDPVIRQTIGARATAMVEVPVLTRRIQPGDIIDASDVVMAKVPRDRYAAMDMITDPRALVGRTGRHSLMPDQPVRGGDVRAPIVINRGSLVTIMLQNAAMTLTVQGRSVGEGGVGDTILVTNTSSNRQLDAVVAGPGLVMVQAGSQPRLPQSAPYGAQRTAMN